jgi:hypothetical protein
MLYPNVDCTITRMTGLYNDFGEAKPEPHKVVSTKCGVKLLEQTEKSSVRADSSASRGFADEVTADARLLFKPKEDVQIGDKVTVASIELRVTAKFPRFDVMGRFDHIQVDLMRW